MLFCPCPVTYNHWMSIIEILKLCVMLLGFVAHSKKGDINTVEGEVVTWSELNKLLAIPDR